MPEIPFDVPLSGPNNLNLSKVPRYPAGANCCVPGSINPWSEYLQATLVQLMMMTVCEMIVAHSHINLATTCRTTRMPIHPGEIRTPAMHVVVPHGKARHITGVDDDRDHRRPWHAVGMHRLVEVVHRDEVVVVGGDIVGQVDPRVIVIDLVVEGLGREGRPSEVVIVLPP